MKTALKLILAIASFSFATASLAQAELSDGAKSALDTAAAGVDTSQIDSAGSKAFLNTVESLIKADPSSALDVVAYAVQLTLSNGVFDDSWLEAIADAAKRAAPDLDLVIRKKITEEAGQPIDIEILIDGKQADVVLGQQAATNTGGTNVAPPVVTSPPAPIQE